MSVSCFAMLLLCGNVRRVRDLHDVVVARSAFKRYEALLFPSSNAHKLDDNGDMDKEVVVTGLDVNVWGTNDTSLHLTTNESYTLTIAAGVATLAAPTVYGALHGIETFSQMLVAQPGGGYMVRVARF